MTAEFDNESTPKQITQISASDNSYELHENECDHLWFSKAGSGYRENPVEMCAKCRVER
jgi:hypothetical protein